MKNQANRMPRWEYCLSRILTRGKPLPVFTTRRGSFLTMLGIRHSAEARAACGLETWRSYVWYLIRTSIRSHKHAIERAAKRGVKA